jgi:WD40 repeat protein
MIHLLLASLSQNKPGQAIRFSDTFEPSGFIREDFKGGEVVPRIDKIELMAMPKNSTLGEKVIYSSVVENSVLSAAHALLSTQPLLWNEKKHGPLCTDIYLECDVNTEVLGESGGLAYSLRLLEALTGYDIDGSQRFIETHQILRQQVIGATGTIDAIGQVGRVDGVEAKLKSFVEKLQNDWPEIQTATGQNHPCIVFLLPKENLQALDQQVLKQAEEALHTLSPNVNIAGIDQLAEAIKVLVGDRFPVLQQDQSPYKGLNAFDPQDRFLFFGREQKINHILEKMTAYSADEEAQRHCIVFGSSGAGKSSFVKAGLLPRLSQYEQSALQNWVILKPGDGQGQLLDYFIDCLRPTLNPGDHKKLLNLPWRKNPDDAVRGFVELYASARCDSTGPDAFVLVLDQAEELLRISESKNDITQFKTIIQAFSSAHLTKKSQTGQLVPICWVISTIREAEYENYKSFLALENEKKQYLPCPLTVLDPSEDIAAYQAIIEQPARLRGIRVAPALTQHLLSVITELKNPLPTLEYALDELYQHSVRTHSLNQGLTLAAFQKTEIIGSMSGLIIRNAQKLLESLKKEPGIHKQIPVFFSLLLGIDKTHGLAHPNPAKIDAFKSSPELVRLYQAFVNHRFLHEDGKKVRFCHEVLIREWNVVQQWAKKTAQQEQTRKLRNLAAGLVFSIALVFIASYAAYYANQQSDHAKLQSDKAKAERDKAKAERDKTLITESRFLADLSLEQTMRGNARLGALLALEALPDYSKKEDQRRPFVFSAERSLYATLGRYVDRLRLKHTNSVNSAVFSPDVSKIVTVSRDKTAHVWDAKTGAVVAVLKGHTSGVNSAVFSPDGSKIATASWDSTARMWDTKTGEIVALRGHTFIVYSAVFSPDGSKIVTASRDKTARVWDTETGAVVAVLKGHADSVNSAVFSPDGSRIVTASSDSTTRVWDTETGATVAVLKGHTSLVTSAIFSPDGSKIVTASWGDRTARVWDTETGAVVAVLKGHAKWVESAVFSPDGSKIVTASWDKTARVWDTETGEVVVVLQGHADRVFNAVFSPDGSKIVTASWDKTARVWDTETGAGAAAAVLEGHAGSVHNAVFSPDGSRIVTASSDSTARVWDIETGEAVAVLRGHADEVYRAVFSPDGSKFVTASEDRTARVWDSRTGAVVAVLKGHADRVFNAVFSPDGSKIVTSSSDNTARVWNTETGAVVAVLTGHVDVVYRVVFSPDGSKIVTASKDKTARVWDTETGAVMAVLKGHAHRVSSAVFSPDGSKIVTASGDNTARVWDTETGAVVAVLTGHVDVVYRVVFSPDGSKIVTASGDNTARVWDTETGAVVAVLTGHVDVVYRVVFSPDGSKIVTASKDKTARVWDTETGAVAAVLEGHAGSVNSAVFNPDGNRIVTASGDNTARVWDTETGAVVAVLTGHTRAVYSAVFSPDGNKIVTVSPDNTVRVWKVFNTKELIEKVTSLELPPLTPQERRQYYLD